MADREARGLRGAFLRRCAGLLPALLHCDLARVSNRAGSILQAAGISWMPARGEPGWK